MRKTALFGIAALLMLGVLAGCASQGTEEKEGKVNVISTFFPLYDFARQIGGEHVSVLNIVPAGVGPHDWTPKSQDMANISKAQLFIYQGAGFEGWADELFANIDTSGLVIVEASKGVSLIEVTPDPAEKESGSGGAAYDPHTWLSPKSALRMAENIKDGLIQADPGNAADYEANYESLIQRLQQLDESYTAQINASPRKEIVVSHDAFGYMARDYALTPLPMMGLAAEAEPTAQDLKEISEFVKENNVRYIFTEALLSDALAKTLANDLGIETLQLHTVEGLTPEEEKAGESYISLMEKNLENLAKALQ